MSQGDSILISGVKFTILKRMSNRLLVSWYETSTGCLKTRWVIKK